MISKGKVLILFTTTFLLGFIPTYVNADGIYSCKVAWHETGGGNKTFTALVTDEKNAVQAARAYCLADVGAIRFFTLNCFETPVKQECKKMSGCMSSIGLKKSGYTKGHKTNWCIGMGYDGVDSKKSICHRKCPSECIKVPLVATGYTNKRGDRTKWCTDKGYEGVRLVKGHGRKGGYCYKGPKNICLAP